MFVNYCDIWKFNVNIVKIKIFIFLKGVMLKCKFLYKGVIIENVKLFCYLGIVLLRSGKFNNVKKYLVE